MKKIFIILLVQVVFSTSAFAKKHKVYTPKQEYKYQQKILRKVEKEKYKRSLLPKSGCMSVEEYEKESSDILNSEKKIPQYRIPKNLKMKYVPQYSYKLVRYNNPPGTAELHLESRFKLDKQVNGGAITSPNKDILVYPVIYYYSKYQCTAGDLFVIPLDKTLPIVDRILRANIIKKIPEPILSTEKNTDEINIFRTLTPIDFSPDGTKLVAKEKIGSSTDGIWQTNLWVYDFNTKEARNLSEVRDAIRFFWKNVKGEYLDEKRWDIYPLGFDFENPDRLVVSAYGYTGKAPKFLGTWSIDCKGEKTLLVSLTEPNAKIGINGYKVVKSEVIDPKQIVQDEKKLKKTAKKDKKQVKKEIRKDKKQKKNVYKKRIKEMKKESSKTIKNFNKQQRLHAPTALDNRVEQTP